MTNKQLLKENFEFKFSNTTVIARTLAINKKKLILKPLSIYTTDLRYEICWAYIKRNLCIKSIEISPVDSLDTTRRIYFTSKKRNNRNYEYMWENFYIQDYIHDNNLFYEYNTYLQKFLTSAPTSDNFSSKAYSNKALTSNINNIINYITNITNAINNNPSPY